MAKISKIQVSSGLYWVQVPEAGLYIMCGCPADSVKHLKKMGLIVASEKHGTSFETGPNAILLSDILVQKECFSNLAEFPVLQMLYKQGMILPGHPNNTGVRPILIGSQEQVASQMQYIYRGNYGLISKKEIMETGISEETANDLMRLKLKFAFGNIRHTEDLLDSKIVKKEPVEIRNGLFIRRLKLNLFELTYNGESVTVDLNLGQNESYETPYPLGFHNIRREYFAVVHAGEGDGWNVNHPCMSSILMFQGKIYLIDAGPNIHHSLKSLGIGINEIEGIFHTHAHDDHFAGLTTLMRSGRKIKYYSVPLVRSSVIKKLSALAAIGEKDFSRYFNIYDLELNRWNDISGLQVKPLLSPHPVETTIYTFRTLSEKGYISYSHYADITSFGILKEMLTNDTSEPGISKSFYEEVRRQYLAGANLKKLDAGGGLIHGNAIDFKHDTSSKILLSHKSSELNVTEKEIGSGAPFGMVDVLIPSNQDYLYQYAFRILSTHFPGISHDRINILLNNEVKTFNPESILVRKDEINSHIYLILTGDVEVIRSESGTCNLLSAGGYAGADSGLNSFPSRYTYRAANFVQVLKLPAALCIDIIKEEGAFENISRLLGINSFLLNTWLLGEEVPFLTQMKIAASMKLKTFKSGEKIPANCGPCIKLVKEGKLNIYLESNLFQTLGPGGFFGEAEVLFGTADSFSLKAVEPTSIYFIPKDLLINIPIVQCKLFETHEKRKIMIATPELMTMLLFEWKKEYETGLTEIDSDHKWLLELAETLCAKNAIGESKSVVKEHLRLLIDNTKAHFKREEALMRKHGYPPYSDHVEKHERLIKEAGNLDKELDTGEIQMNKRFIGFIKKWVVSHIIYEDIKIGAHIRGE